MEVRTKHFPQNSLFCPFYNFFSGKIFGNVWPNFVASLNIKTLNNFEEEKTNHYEVDAHLVTSTGMT
jgi:hypothetical protein